MSNQSSIPGTCADATVGDNCSHILMAKYINKAS